MVIAIGVLLALVCLVVAAIPFLKYRHSRQTVDPLQVISELQNQRQRLYKELLTLEENSKTGAVPEPEFNAVSLTLRRRAAENLWIQRRWEERLTDLDLAIEQLISLQKQGVSSLQDATTHEQGHNAKLCPECGAQVPINTPICPKCGAQPEKAQPAL